MKTSILRAAILGLGTAFALLPGTGQASSNFQQTCSNIAFGYQNNQPAVTATCLRANGTPNATSLVLTGIENRNGTLASAGGPATFQQSCGNIQVAVDNATTVRLTAFCRMANGAPNATAISLDGIQNIDGTLRR